jgi:DNA-binding Lrp family transcriptional regulator
MTDLDTQRRSGAVPITTDRLDWQLIHALQADGRAPFSRIADVLGVSDQTVARRYRRLRAVGALRVLVIPNAHRLGHGQWHVRLQCTPDASAAVATALARRPDTSWIYLTSGGTEITCTTYPRTEREHHELLLGKLPRTSRVVALSAHAQLHTFVGEPTSLMDKLGVLTPEQVGALRPPAPHGVVRDGKVELTTEDDRLLEVLTHDGRTGYPQLAAVTGWSESTVRRRLEYLLATGAVYCDVDVDARILGYRAQAILWLTVAPAKLAVVGAALAEHPEIAWAAATTGTTNLAASAVCRDVDALYEYLTDRVGILDGVQQVETAPVIRVIKRAGAVLPG